MTCALCGEPAFAKLGDRPLCPMCHEATAAKASQARPAEVGSGTIEDVPPDPNWRPDPVWAERLAGMIQRQKERDAARG